MTTGKTGVGGCDCVVERSYPLSEFRVGGREEQPHSRGVVASQEQEGLEKLVHVHKKILAYNFLFWWCLCLVLESV